MHVYVRNFVYVRTRIKKTGIYVSVIVCVCIHTRVLHTLPPHLHTNREGETYARTHARKHMHTYEYTYAQTCQHTHTHTRTHMNTNIPTQLCTRPQLHVYTRTSCCKHEEDAHKNTYATMHPPTLTHVYAHDLW